MFKIIEELWKQLISCDFNTASRYVALAKFGLYPWFGSSGGLYSAISSSASHSLVGAIEDGYARREVAARFAGSVVKDGLNITSYSIHKTAEGSSEDVRVVCVLEDSGVGVLNDLRLAAEGAFYRSCFIEATTLAMTLGSVTYQYNQGLIHISELFHYSFQRIVAAIFAVTLSTSGGALGSALCPAPLLGNMIGSTVGGVVGDCVGQAVAGAMFMAALRQWYGGAANVRRLHSRKSRPEDSPSVAMATTPVSQRSCPF